MPNSKYIAAFLVLYILWLTVIYFSDWKKNIKLFWAFCIPARICVILINNRVLNGLFALGFLQEFTRQSYHRYTNNGLEKIYGTFGDTVYWHPLRLFHAITYAAAAMFPQNGQLILVFDLVVSLLSHINARYQSHQILALNARY